jgi:hypothetical protein
MITAEAPIAIDQTDISKKSDRQRTSRRFLGGTGGLALLGVSVALAGCGGTTRSNTSSNAKETATQTSIDSGYPAPGPKVLLKGSRHTEIEQSTGGAETFVNYKHAAGQGPTIPLGDHVVVDCLATGPLSAAPSAHGNLRPVKLPDGKTEPKDHGAKWYHVTAPAQFAGYFTASNAYDNGDIQGPLASQPAEDINVPACP